MPFSKLFLVVFGNNWRAILLSVIAATTFWFFNALNKSYSTRLNYPLEFNFQRDSVVVVSPLPNRIIVDVTGGGWNLVRKTFLLSAGPVVIDLDNPTEIKFLTRATFLPLISEELSGLTLDFVLTDTLFVNIEPKISKVIYPLVDSLSVPLEEGYRIISEIRLEPDSLVVEGPKSMIDTISDTYYLQMTDNSIDNSYNDESDVEFESDLIRSFPDEIGVRFSVAEFSRSVVTVPIEATNFPQDSSIYLQDSVINIYYVSRTRDLGKINTSDFNVAADLTMMIERDSAVVPILTAFPSFVMELDLKPDTLSVVYAQ